MLILNKYLRYIYICHAIQKSIDAEVKQSGRVQTEQVGGVAIDDRVALVPTVAVGAQAVLKGCAGEFKN